MKKRKLNLIWKILIGIALGIGIGWVAPEWCGRLAATLNYIFSQLLGFLIPLIIVGFVTPAIADVGSRAGKLLIVTALLAYFFTFCSGMLSYFTGVMTFPSLIAGEEGVAAVEEAAHLKPYFTVDIPAPMPVMTALVISFMFGLGVAFIKGDVMRGFFTEMRASILCGGMLRRPQSLQNAGDHASGLSDGTRHPIIGGHNPCDTASDHQDGSGRGCRRICSAALRHNPYVRLGIEDHSLCARSAYHAWPAV